MEPLAVPPADVAGIIEQLARRGLVVFLVAAPSGVTMPATLPAVASAMPAPTSPAFAGHTVAETAIAALQSKQERGCRRSYLNTLSSTLNIFGETFGKRPLHSITAGEVEAWLSDPKWNPETRRGYLKNVRTLFSFAVKRRWVARNVAFDLDMPMPANKAPGILPVADAAKLMRACQDEDRSFVPWLAVQLFGGLRVAEAEGLTPADFTGPSIQIAADRCKTRKRRLAPVNDTLRAWLAVGDGYSSTNWRKRYRRIQKLAGIHPPKNALRHSFVSYSVALHPAGMVAAWAGHSESVLFAHYRELVTEADAKAFWAIRP